MNVSAKYELASGVDPSIGHQIDQYIARIGESRAPVLFSPSHFCSIVGVDTLYAYAVANNQSPNYRTFFVGKRTGGVRVINEPLPTLKMMQRWILDNILYTQEFGVSATAYVKDRSIKDNARIHRAQKCIMKLDIVSFFPSIGIDAVHQIFYDMGYTRSIATFLSKICTREGVLPQGAPTSGALANLRMKKFDQEMLEECRSIGARYTRYADDITISGNEEKFETLQAFAKQSLRALKLRLNDKKTLHARSSGRMIVTGIVVNQKLNLPREFLSGIRQEYYYVNKLGIREHAKRTRRSSARYALDALMGKVAFALGIRPYDIRLRGMLTQLSLVRRELLGEERPIHPEPALPLPGEDLP